MKKSFSSLLALLFLPLLALAQLVTVPKNVYFADIHLRISDGAQEEIQKKVDALHRNQTYFKMKVDLADTYFPVIERVFKEEGVPDDYKYLALQESGLLGDAVSTSNAVGYWQFKREAALDFNLRMDNKIDERRHIIEASRGAAKYFLRSNKYYNNWFNSLLSYYLGYTGAKAYTSPSDNGARKMDVTEKSHPYVITFLAHKIAYDVFVGKANPPALSLREIRGTAGQSLADIAMSTQTDYAELEKYNKWLLGSSIPSDKDYYVMVPVRNGNSDGGLLASKDTATPITTRKALSARISKQNGLSTVTAQPGDTKDKLAMKAGLSTRKFLKYNDLHNFDEIVAGAAYYTEKKNMTADAEYHVVQPGETMQLISQHYGIRLNYLLFKNRMNRREVPVPGRVLWLQQRRPAHTPVEVRDLNKTQTKTATAPGSNRPATNAVQSKQDDRQQDDNKASESKPASDGNIFKRFINSFKRFKNPQPEQQEQIEEEEEIVVAERTVVVEKKTKVPAPSVATETAVAVKAEPTDEEWLEAVKEERVQTEKTEAMKKAEAPVTKVPAAEPQKKQPALYPQTGTMEPIQEPAQQAPIDTLPAAGEMSPAEADTLNTSPIPVEEEEQAQQEEELVEEQAEEWNIGAKDGTAKEPEDIFREPAATPVTKPATNTVKREEVAPVAAPKPTKHVVKQGETLYGISRMYAVTVNDLTAWNKLGDVPIQMGQELLIAEPLVQPEQEATAEDVPATMLSTTSDYHTVVAGETLYQISKKYSVSLEDMRNWNKLTDNNIRLRQELRVKAPAGATAPATATESGSAETSALPSTGYHTVADGESMYQISRKYGVTIKDIMGWNNKSDFAVSVGERLLIKKK
ncbi:LysM peptidoglycan-binding domain-containing protein [Pontibacter pamirensis]|uniref:LysM peptidoglycan-binding domain-containing protein n=1 Tax=Pontibacter pamirensis TaxID=2562824 RepID=UPI001389905E|nr:LysM peptidoglycan-binding domain-containing protein [Pontibacter pamirensis]